MASFYSLLHLNAKIANTVDKREGRTGRENFTDKRRRDRSCGRSDSLEK